MVTLTILFLCQIADQPVTLLLLGSDTRDPQEPGRSDTIIVLHADPAAREVRGLTLPRDLYVSLHGLDRPLTNRLNAALFFGDYFNVSGGGLHAARETVQHHLGIPMNGTFLVRFGAVEDVVDSLGGVEIYFEHPVTDRSFHPLKAGRSYALRFESGWNYLDGSRALEFIRLRRPDTDFGRMGRNRKLLEALVAQVRGPGGTWRVTRLLPTLFGVLRSDLGLLEKVRVAWVFYRCAERPISWRSLAPDEVEPCVTAQGAQVLLPDPELLKDLGQWLHVGTATDVAGLRKDADPASRL